MNKNNIWQRFWVLAGCLSMTLLAGCGHEKRVDVCSMDNPPKNAVVENAGHVGRSFTYPDMKSVPDNYSGCVKVWLGNYGENPAPFYLLGSFRFEGGSVSRVEFFEPNKDKLVCEFDKHRSVTLGPPDKCLDFANLPIKK